MTKIEAVKYITDKAGKKVSDAYLQKVARKRSWEALARILDFLQAEMVSAKFAYSVMTSGIYE